MFRVCEFVPLVIGCSWVVKQTTRNVALRFFQDHAFLFYI